MGASVLVCALPVLPCWRGPIWLSLPDSRRSAWLFALSRSDEALAALLPCLPLLRVLSLERCSEAGNASLGAIAKHVSVQSGGTSQGQLGLGQLAGGSKGALRGGHRA